MNLRLRVMTPTALVFDGPVASVVAPGAWGYLGILDHHRPLATPLVSGNLVFRTEQGQRLLRVDGGFLEVHRNLVTVLADSAQAPKS